MSTLTNLQVVWNSYDNQYKIHKASPMVARETASVREAAPTIKSVDDLIANRQVFNYVLKAYGMEDIPYPAMIKKLLEEGTKDPKAFASRYVDPRYKEFVNDMGFAEGKDGNFDSYFWMEKLVKKYNTVSFEESKGQSDVNVQLALYFERKAPEMESWYQVLGDKAVSQVVFKAFGMPDSVRLGDIDKLAELLSKRMPIEDFKNPEKVKSLVQRFAIFADQETNLQNSPVLQLFQGASLGPRTVINIDPMMLAEANKMRFL